MAGDLATALAAGNAPPGFAGDPALAQIAPQLQLASVLSQAGMSGAPASPWQAAGRLGSSLAGALIQGQAQDELRNLYSGASDEMGKIFPAGTPQGDASRSKSPLVRMLAAQNFPKALLLSNEQKLASPGQNIIQPGPIPPGGGVVGGNTNPTSDVGKLVRDAELAAARGNPGGANAISQGVSKATTTPEGVPYAPAPIVPNRVHTIPASGPGGGMPYQRPEDMPAAVAAAAGNKKGQEETYGAAGKALGNVIGEHIEAGGKAARDKLNALDTMESALATGSKGMITGPNAEFALKVKQALDGMGLDSSWIKEGLAQSEIYQKMNMQLASASAKAMTNRPTQNELQGWMKTNPGLLMSKEGSKAMIDILRQQTNNDIELGRLAQKKSNWENWGDTVEKFYADTAHALKNPITGKPMRDEIAAAHAGGGTGAAANPNETTAKAIPSIGQTMPDEHGVPHKYLGGNPRDKSSWGPMVPRI